MKHIHSSGGTFLLAILLSLPSAALLAQQATKARKQVAAAKTAFPFKTTLPAVAADSLAYAFGMSMAQDLKQRGLTGLNAASVALAIRDVFDNKPAQLNEEQQRDLITAALTSAMAERDSSLKRDAVSYMQKNKTKPGIHTTPSGLQYEIIKPGAGEKVGANDTVQVHYKGALADGKTFDSSYDRGEPNSFGVSQVIPGWTEGLQLMSPGAHYRFYIPFELGYGERGAGQDIPPYSPLVFDVELLSVKKAIAGPVANN